MFAGHMWCVVRLSFNTLGRIEQAQPRGQSGVLADLMGLIRVANVGEAGAVPRLLDFTLFTFTSVLHFSFVSR